MEDRSSSQESTSKGSARPQSMLAVSLAAQLDSAFSLDHTSSELENLAQTVTLKKADVEQKAHELHELEACLRETEKRLQQQQQQQQQQMLLQSQQAASTQQHGQPPAPRASNSPQHTPNLTSPSQTSFTSTKSYLRSSMAAHAAGAGSGAGSGCGPAAGSPGSASPRPASRTSSVRQLSQAHQYHGADVAGRYAQQHQQQQILSYGTASGR
ncbi:hypothetical protein KEM52_000701 [Ascosphaera acerosa]|nr:hypothetical protein KEM52_000701 [Ascosphaera acerosa]